MGSSEFAHLRELDMNALCARVVVHGRKPEAPPPAAGLAAEAESREEAALGWSAKQSEAIRSNQKQSEAALGWSAKQAHILTGGGVAEELYSASRGYAHEPTELPHHHLVRGSSHAAFAAWAAEARVPTQTAAVVAAEAPPSVAQSVTQSVAQPVTQSVIQPVQPPSWLAGAWSRPLFVGGGLVSTDADDSCCNVVTTHGPFVDVRIPTSH